MAFGTRAHFDTIREVAFGDISGSYAAVGTPLSDYTRIVCFTNSTGEDVYVSDDGVNAKLRVVANSYKLLDISANKIRDDGLFLPIGLQFYVKQVTASPTSGGFWIEILSAEGGT